MPFAVAVTTTVYVPAGVLLFEETGLSLAPPPAPAQLTIPIRPMRRIASLKGSRPFGTRTSGTQMRHRNGILGYEWFEFDPGRLAVEEAP